MSWRQSFLWSLHQLHWGVHWVHLLLHPKPFISAFPSYLFQIRVGVDSIFYLSQIEDQRENNLTKTKTIPAKITVISKSRFFVFNILPAECFAKGVVVQTRQDYLSGFCTFLELPPLPMASWKIDTFLKENHWKTCVLLFYDHS